MTPLKLALLSLDRHRLATIIIICAIGMGVAVCGILLRLNQASEARFSTLGQGFETIVGAKAGGIEITLGALNAEGDYPNFLPYSLFESLKSRQAVKHGDGATTTPSYIHSITPFVYFGKLQGSKLQNYRVVGTDESFFNRKKFASGNWSGARGQAVLGHSVAKRMKLKIGDSLKFRAWLGDDALGGEASLTVSGILAPTRTNWDNQIFSSVQSAHDVFRTNLRLLPQESIWGGRALHYFLVNLAPGAFEEFASLVNNRTVGQLVDVDDQFAKLKELTGAGKNIGFLVTIFILFLGALSITSMLITRFEGMSLQFAVLRAIGYTRGELARILVWEGFLLGLSGVFLGALIDWTIFPVLRNLLGEALPPPDIAPSSVFQSWLVWAIALAATISSVVIPMTKVARQDAHALLRGM